MKKHEKPEEKKHVAPKREPRLPEAPPPAPDPPAPKPPKAVIPPAPPLPPIEICGHRHADFGICHLPKGHVGAHQHRL